MFLKLLYKKKSKTFKISSGLSFDALKFIQIENVAEKSIRHRLRNLFLSLLFFGFRNLEIFSKADQIKFSRNIKIHQLSALLNSKLAIRQFVREA